MRRDAGRCAVCFSRGEDVKNKKKTVYETESVRLRVCAVCFHYECLLQFAKLCL